MLRVYLIYVERERERIVYRCIDICIYIAREYMYSVFRLLYTVFQHLYSRCWPQPYSNLCTLYSCHFFRILYSGFVFRLPHSEFHIACSICHISCMSYLVISLCIYIYIWAVSTHIYINTYIHKYIHKLHTYIRTCIHYKHTYIPKSIKISLGQTTINQNLVQTSLGHQNRPKLVQTYLGQTKIITNSIKLEKLWPNLKGNWLTCLMLC